MNKYLSIYLFIYLFIYLLFIYNTTIDTVVFHAKWTRIARNEYETMPSLYESVICEQISITAGSIKF